MKTTSTALLALALLLGTAIAGEKAAAAPAGAREVLNTKSYWRWHVTYSNPTYKDKDGKDQPLKRKGRRKRFDPDRITSAPPPTNWMATNFDDRGWPRSRIPWSRPVAFGRFSVARVSMRGRFTVTDPAAAKLYISSRHVGGLIIYLNGQEVGRTNMPEGKIDNDTLANVYDDKVYLGKNGKPHPKFLAKWAVNQLPIKLRGRSMAPVELPAKLLKKGVNVLAVEVRRARYSAAAMKWLVGRSSAYGPQWIHASLMDLRLRCAGGGATPNVARPKGVQVWNHDRNDRVTVYDYGDPGEGLRPVKIIGAKNGSFCGQVIISSRGAISGVKVTPGELKGPGSIPAKNVTVLYGRMNWHNRRVGTWCDSLQQKPITDMAVNRKAKAATLPLLFRVKIPADAKAGIYKGSIAVSASGKSFDVPIELDVADWKIPDPRDYRTYMGIYQSPTSVALRYKVDMWSEQHWKLVEKSIAQLARVGNKMVNIPVVEQTQFGNDKGFVTWIRKADGSYDHDLSIMEKYVKLALKHWGSLDYVTLQIWHAAGGGGKGGWDTRPANTKCTVTVRDEKSGKIESVQVPVFGTPESKKFWRPVLAKIKKSLTKLGAEKGMCVGILSDSTAPKAVFTMFNEVFPGGKGALWHRGCHTTTNSMTPYQVKGAPRTNNVILHEHCYGMSMVSPGIKVLPAFHTFRGRPGTAYFRIVGHEGTATLLSNRTMAMRGMFCQKQGVGRICLDYWGVMKDKRGRSSHIFNRWPHSTCAQRKPTLLKLTWPGAEGAETTLRYEALVEGVQESEAMIVVSEGAASEDKVGKELAGKCRKVIRDYLRFCHYKNQISEHFTVVHVDHHGWQELARRVFKLAGEVSRKLGGKSK
jgi:Glycoside hydrolase 123, catalytic domain